MENLRLLLVAAAIVCPGSAAAETAGQSQAILPASTGAVSEKDALKAFDADERTAIDAIKKDSSLTPIQKKQQIVDLKKDDKAKRSALRDKYADKRDDLHDVIRTHAADDRRERSERSRLR